MIAPLARARCWALGLRYITDLVRPPKYRRIVVLGGALYLLVYLYTLRQVVFLPEPAMQGLPPLAVEGVSDWPSKVWKAIAPFSYEPVAAVYIGRRVALFLAVPNLLLGLALGGLVGLNVAVAVAHTAEQKACRRPAAGLLGTLPSLLTGFSCCVPTVALALGANSVLALIALRSYFVPLSFVLLTTGLLWGVWRLNRPLPLVHPVSSRQGART